MEFKSGQVFHLWCRFCNPQKYKYFVVASIDPGPWFFLINSEPTEFQKKRPRLMSSLVALPAHSNTFLSHDSWLDCTELLGGYSGEDIENLLQQDPRVLLGRLAANSRRAVRAVISASPLLAEAKKKVLLTIW